MDADQMTLELAQDAPRRSMQRLVVHSLMPHIERFENMPEGWKIDKSWGSPEAGWEPICNGKSVLNGGKKGLLKVGKPNRQPVVYSCSTIHTLRISREGI